MPRSRTERVIEKIYQKAGPVYNFVYSKLLFNEGREIAIDMLRIEPGNKILEVGVGTGLTLPLYPKNCEVIGVDLSESMLEEARKLITEKKLHLCSVKNMNATKLDFPQNYFDSVLGNLFISATTEPEKSLVEMKRVCKPGGRIVLMNHFKSGSPVIAALEKAINPLALALGFKSDLEMLPLLHSVGLEPLEVKKVNLFGLWTAVAMDNKK